jgi:hypothetical protein
MKMRYVFPKLFYFKTKNPGREQENMSRGLFSIRQRKSHPLCTPRSYFPFKRGRCQRPAPSRGHRRKRANALECWCFGVRRGPAGLWHLHVPRREDRWAQCALLAARHCRPRLSFRRRSLAPATLPNLKTRTLPLVHRSVRAPRPRQERKDKAVREAMGHDHRCAFIFCFSSVPFVSSSFSRRLAACKHTPIHTRLIHHTHPQSCSWE